MKPVLPFLILLLSSVVFLHAAPLPSAVTETDLDVAACQILRGAVAEPLDADTLHGLLGFDEVAGKETKRPRPARAPQGEALPQYLLVFKKPIAIGTVLGASGELRLHKSAAPWPANVANPSDWVSLEVPASQSSPSFAPLPPGTQTRALLASLPARKDGPYLRLLEPRVTNHTPAGTANAEAEWTTEPMLSAPYTFDAGHVTRGYGEWINAGKNGKGINPHAPITDVAPTWIVLSWPEKRAIDGVVLQDNFDKFELQTYEGPAGLNPAAATEQEWKTQRKFQQTLVSGQRWLLFPQVETRALRLRVTKVSGNEPSVAHLAGLHAFAMLGNQPAPVLNRRVEQEPPLKIPYDLAQAGQVTLVIDGPEGTRVRNVIANVDQSAGANAVSWDLRNEAGEYVPPGKYKWKALTHPPLEFRYEMTAYPNVTSYFPERPAWLTGPDGPGGWLADHTPPRAACSAGDRVFLGAAVSESGVSLIECDLEGRKLWGHASFAGFTGVGMLASDGQTLFNMMSAANFAAAAGMDKSTEGLWAIDLKTRAVRTLATLQPTAERKRGVQGIAARDNKVYLAVRSPADWLVNAAAAVDVDALHCLPAYGTPRPARAAHEVVPDPRNDFLKLFRLKDQPSGQNLIYLESTKGSEAQQHILLAFSKPVALGSLVFPPPAKEDKLQFQISVLKSNAPYPPRPQEKADWEVVPLADPSAWAVVPLPAGTMTRAVRFTFSKGGAGSADDLLFDVEDKKAGPSLDKVGAGGKKAGLGSGDTSEWQRRLDGVKLLNRRYENVASKAAIRVNSGKVAPDGSWDADRTQPISTAEPAVYALEWKQPETIRGLALKEIDGAVTEIDVFNGAAGQKVDLEASEGWENVSTYNQPLRNYYMPDETHNSKARYLDGYVDFGREVSTRAVRLRVVKQWDTKAHYPSGVRDDQGGQVLDSKRCHVYGVAALKYLGGEPAVDPLVTERLEVIDGTSGKIVQEMPLPKVGKATTAPLAQGNALAFNAKGELFAISDDNLVRVDMASGKVQVLASDLQKPTALATDNAGNLLVFDAAKERNTIRVYDSAGKFLRAIGTPGGRQRGAWDPTKLEYVSALTVDSSGQIWAVEQNYWPKRVSIWSKDGTFQKEFTGPTEYGGGGCLDPSDKRRLFYGPLEFELDWTSGKTHLKNLTSLDGADTGDVPRIVNGQLYLVNTRPTNNPNYGLVYKHEGDHERIVACVGIAGYCKPMLDPKLVKAFGGKTLIDYQCAWSDLNGDEQVQPEEVQLWPKEKGNTPVVFDNQLNAQVGQLSYRVKKWLPNGVPVYERVEMPELWSGTTVHLDNGNYYHVEGPEHTALAAGLAPDGKVLWTYETEGSGGHALPKASPLHAGQILCDIGLAGHTTAHAGDLGEFVVFNTNVGLFNIITADGFFAGQLFKEVRDREARPWSMPETARGMSLAGMTPGQEHFNGYFCKTADNKYYAVAGHNHASVVEVVGMDKYKRFEGEIEVSPKVLAATQQWDRERVTHQVYARAPVVDCYRMTQPPKLDGQLNDWPFVSAEMENDAKFRIGYDNDNLYLAYEIDRHGPLKNQGQQWDRLFKTGASVDLQIGADPNAPSDRKSPQAGDERLLMTMMGNEPAAVLYQAFVPGTPPDKAWQVVSPVGRVTFDKVARLEKPRIATYESDNRYVVEASIPLATLGLKITPGLRLKMDWGVLVSGPNGTEVLRREYWSNKATQIIADAPSEAELHPELWGHIRFHDEAANAHLDPTAAKADKSLTDLLNDLK